MRINRYCYKDLNIRKKEFFFVDLQLKYDNFIQVRISLSHIAINYSHNNLSDKLIISINIWNIIV